MAHVMSFGTGRYGVAGDEDFVISRRDQPQGDYPPPAIWLGGRGSQARGNMAWLPTWIDPMVDAHTIGSADMSGGLVWGNPTSRNAMTGYANYLTGGDQTKKIGLILTSMSGLLGFNWARANPNRVAWIAALAPALNLASLKTVTGGVYGAEINAAYGGAYTAAAYGSTSSPYVYRDSIPGTFRVGLWTTPNDEICLPQWSTALAASLGARCDHFQITNPNGTGVGHGGVLVAVPKIIEWVNRR